MSTTEDPDAPPPSTMPRVFAGFALIVTINLTLVAILSVMTFLLQDWAGLGVGLFQLVYVLPLVVWRFMAKDTALASGMILGAAVTLMLNLGGVMLYGLIAFCGGFH